MRNKYSIFIYKGIFCLLITIAYAVYSFAFTNTFLRYLIYLIFSYGIVIPAIQSMTIQVAEVLDVCMMEMMLVLIVAVNIRIFNMIEIVLLAGFGLISFFITFSIQQILMH